MIQANQEKLLPASISIPNKIQNLAKTIQFFSGNLVTKFSAKLFSTPVKFPTPEREKMMWKSAQKSRLMVPSINKEIEILTYGFSKKKVLLVHGWCGRSTQLFMVADKLLENGYMIISFDAPSHGNSEGKSALMPDFIDAIKEIDEKLGPFDAAVGHSLGGMSLYSAIAEGVKVKSMVSIGSGDKISDIIKNFIKNLSLKPKVATKLKKFYDQKHEMDIDSYASSAKAKEVDIPALVVHDSLDGDVPVSCAYNIRQSLKQGSIFITSGLGHTKILRDKNTTARIVDFIKHNE
ncbi:alpha/beta fold hydrolase [Tenacibaculum sp. M341]|uniref:alpha/beta fold hydrolase n=1 Tax=Tenacibaculum sp. M341 TaxID=2530339 RepID=UPI0010482DEF|nr:alpha/beta fold hydrolase [Tenacibaculum sp. M341]TCI91037.1 alpha/beta fold hydrolase [Tenacibaculum sp. M341]